MADDSISRQAAIDAVRHSPIIEVQPAYMLIDKADVLKNIVMLPSAQLERKKGKWIYYPIASGSVTSIAVHLYPVCSECGCEHPIANFCPNCGARMEEDS